jgi:AhpD family alkylhydroperoxidase
MDPRADTAEHTPDVVKQAIALQAAIEATGIDKTILELIKIRASQINGCAYCLNMHVRDARKLGENEMRLHLLPAWRESTLYTPRERAVLAWTESLTFVPERGAPSALYQELKAHFDDKQIASITSAVAMINFWNRVAVGLAKVWPGEDKAAR